MLKKLWWWRRGGGRGGGDGGHQQLIQDLPIYQLRAAINNVVVFKIIDFIEAVLGG